MPVIALGDGFAHIIGGGVFVFPSDFGPLNFFGFGGEDDVEGVFGIVSHHQGDFGTIEIGVGEDEFVGAGSEVEVEIAIEAGLTEFGAIAIEDLHQGKGRFCGIYHQAGNLGLR